MTTFTFQPAVKEARKLRLAIAGPSGAGKTYTALALGVELGKKVAVIDTERHSAALYADLFNFDTLALNTFAPDTLVKVLAAETAAAYDVVIVDSLSHFWSGIEGMLEQVDNAAKRSAGGNSFGGWKEARPMERRMIDALLAYPGHVIVTMRTKTEWVVEEDSRGRKVPRKIGLKPEQREGVEYEFDVVGDMDLENNFVISKTRVVTLAGQVIRKPGADLAKTLSTWLSSGAKAPTVNDYIDRATDATAGRDDLLKLLGEVNDRGLAGAPVQDETGEATTLAAFIIAKGKALHAEEQRREAAQDGYLDNADPDLPGADDHLAGQS